MKQSSEAVWWSIFSAGGVVSALFLPVLVVVTGLVVPFGDVAWAELHATVTWWPLRVVLFAVVFLSLFHAAHRIRHIVMDLGWRRRTAPLSVLSYGGALGGTAAAAWILIGLA